jgi:hypothetical protein
VKEEHSYHPRHSVYIYFDSDFGAIRIEKKSIDVYDKRFYEFFKEFGDKFGFEKLIKHWEE